MRYELGNEEIERILARCNATFFGEWKSYIKGRERECGSDFIKTGTGKNRDKDIELLGATKQDRNFIAHSKQDIPKF